MIKHQSEGKAFFSFAGKLGVSIETLYEWSRKHKEFSDAKKTGHAKCFEFWEKIGMRSLIDQKINTTQYIYQMKCRFRDLGYNTGVDNAPPDEIGFEFVE